MDAAFLGRVYRTALWFGTVITLCVLSATQSLILTFSFGLGLACGALMLKSQELFVLRILGGAGGAGTTAPRTKIFAMLAIKYILLVVALEALFYLGLIQPPAFAIGFMTMHLVIVSKVAGNTLRRKLRPISEVHDN